MVNRREFLRRTGLAAAGSLVTTGFADPAPAAASVRFVFATDVHMMAGNFLASEQGLAKCLDVIEALTPRPEFILCGGDFVHEAPYQGLDDAAKLFDRFLSIWNQHTSLPTRWAFGNHDLAGTHAGLTRRDDPRFGKGLFLQRLAMEKSYYAFDAGAWRLSVLDDVVVHSDGGYHGEFLAEQMDFLRNDLAAHPKQPSLMCCHIPAVSALPTMVSVARVFGSHIDPGDTLVVRNPPALLDAVKAAGIAPSIVLSGHLHHGEQTDAGGIRYLTAGAVCGNWWRGPQAGCPEGFLIVDLNADGTYATEYRAYGWTAAG